MDAMVDVRRLTLLSPHELQSLMQLRNFYAEDIRELVSALRDQLVGGSGNRMTDAPAARMMLDAALLLMLPPSYAVDVIKLFSSLVESSGINAIFCSRHAFVSILHLLRVTSADLWPAWGGGQGAAVQIADALTDFLQLLLLKDAKGSKIVQLLDHCRGEGEGSSSTWHESVLYVLGTTLRKQRMIEASSPSMFFDLDGKNASLKVEGVEAWPGKGYTFLMWFRSPSRAGQPKVPLFSFRDEQGQGIDCAFDVLGRRFVLHVYHGRNQTQSISSDETTNEEEDQRASKWRCLIMTHHRPTLGRSSIDLYLDGTRLITGGILRYPKIASMSNAWLGAAILVPEKPEVECLQGQLGMSALLNVTLTETEASQLFHATSGKHGSVLSSVDSLQCESAKGDKDIIHIPKRLLAVKSGRSPFVFCFDPRACCVGRRCPTVDVGRVNIENSVQVYAALDSGVTVMGIKTLAEAFSSIGGPAYLVPLLLLPCHVAQLKKRMPSGPQWRGVCKGAGLTPSAYERVFDIFYSLFTIFQLGGDGPLQSEERIVRALASILCALPAEYLSKSIVGYIKRIASSLSKFKHRRALIVRHIILQPLFWQRAPYAVQVELLHDLSSYLPFAWGGRSPSKIEGIRDSLLLLFKAFLISSRDSALTQEQQAHVRRLVLHPFLIIVKQHKDLQLKGLVLNIILEHLKRTLLNTTPLRSDTSIDRRTLLDILYLLICCGLNEVSQWHLASHDVDKETIIECSLCISSLQKHWGTSQQRYEGLGQALAWPMLMDDEYKIRLMALRLLWLTRLLPYFRDTNSESSRSSVSSSSASDAAFVSNVEEVRMIRKHRMVVDDELLNLLFSRLNNVTITDSELVVLVNMMISGPPSAFVFRDDNFSESSIQDMSADGALDPKLSDSMFPHILSLMIDSDPAVVSSAMNRITVILRLDCNIDILLRTPGLFPAMFRLIEKGFSNGLYDDHIRSLSTSEMRWASLPRTETLQVLLGFLLYIIQKPTNEDWAFENALHAVMADATESGATAVANNGPLLFIIITLLVRLRNVIRAQQSPVVLQRLQQRLFSLSKVVHSNFRRCLEPLKFSLDAGTPVQQASDAQNSSEEKLDVLHGALRGLMSWSWTTVSKFTARQVSMALQDASTAASNPSNNGDGFLAVSVIGSLYPFVEETHRQIMYTKYGNSQTNIQTQFRGWLDDSGVLSAFQPSSQAMLMRRNILGYFLHQMFLGLRAILIRGDPALLAAAQKLLQSCRVLCVSLINGLEQAERKNLENWIRCMDDARPFETSSTLEICTIDDWLSDAMLQDALTLFDMGMSKNVIDDHERLERVVSRIHGRIPIHENVNRQLSGESNEWIDAAEVIKSSSGPMKREGDFLCADDEVEQNWRALEKILLECSRLPGVWFQKDNLCGKTLLKCGAFETSGKKRLRIKQNVHGSLHLDAASDNPITPIEKEENLPIPEALQKMQSMVKVRSLERHHDEDDEDESVNVATDAEIDPSVSTTGEAHDAYDNLMDETNAFIDDQHDPDADIAHEEEEYAVSDKLPDYEEDDIIEMTSSHGTTAVEPTEDSEASSRLYSNEKDKDEGSQEQDSHGGGGSKEVPAEQEAAPEQTVHGSSGMRPRTNTESSIIGLARETSLSLFHGISSVADKAAGLAARGIQAVKKNAPSLVYSDGTSRRDSSWLTDLVISGRTIHGKICVENSHLIFLPKQKENIDDHKFRRQATKVRKWRISDICDVQIRRFLLERSAFEIMFWNGKSIFVHMRTHAIDETSNSTRDFQLEKVAMMELYRKLQTLADPRSRLPRTLSQPKNVIRKSEWTRAWQRGQISNFDYLMLLNSAAGRSYHDLTQYPVLPWILSDYSSATIDLSDDAVYRDLSKPVGALNPVRLDRLRERNALLEDDPESPGFLYGSHYSTMATVLFYLIRLEPYSTLAIELQSGKFDHADRLFHSIAEVYANCVTHDGDVKELIPEFFTCPDAFRNNGLPLGTRQNGVRLGDVVLPPWANGSPEEFIRIQRAALESENVSANLHNWIDLIFGFKQRGNEALAADNLFHYLTYEGCVDLNSVDDPVLRMSIETQIANFGQTPMQLFTKPHPARSNSIHARPLQVAYSLSLSGCALSSSLELEPTTSFGTEVCPALSNLFTEPSKSKIHIIDCDGTVRSYLWGYDAAADNSTKIRPNLKPIHSVEGVFHYLSANEELISFYTGEKRNRAQNFLAILSPTPWLRGPLDRSGRLLDLQSKGHNAPSVIISAGHWDGAVVSTKLADKTKVSRTLFAKHDGELVTCVAISEDSLKVAYGSSTGIVTIYSLRSRDRSSGKGKVLQCELRCSVIGHHSAITVLSVNRNLDVVLSGDSSGVALVHSLATGTLLHTLAPPPEEKYTSVIFCGIGHVNGEFIVGFRRDLESTHLYVFSHTGKTLAEYSTGPLISVEISPCGRFALTCDSNHGVAIRYLHSLHPIMILRVSRSGLSVFNVQGASFSPDGSHILVNRCNGGLMCFELPT